jgi:hypothetical protein
MESLRCLILALMQLSDSVSGGIFLHAYFRKVARRAVYKACASITNGRDDFIPRWSNRLVPAAREQRHLA